MGAQPGDYVVDMSVRSVNVFFDIHDHLRARKAELRAEWIEKNPEEKHLLKPVGYGSIRDGANRIPYADEGRKTIIASKIKQRSMHSAEMAEHNKIPQDVLFVRDKHVPEQFRRLETGGRGGLDSPVSQLQP